MRLAHVTPFAVLLAVLTAAAAAPQIADPDRREFLEDMIRQIDDGEVLFMEIDGQLVPTSPDELASLIGQEHADQGRLEVDRAVVEATMREIRGITRAVRDRLRSELDALPAGGPAGTQELPPLPRDFPDPPPFAWDPDVRGISDTERCAVVRDRIPLLEREERESRSEIDAARDRIDNLDRQSWEKWESLVGLLKLTGLDGKIPSRVLPTRAYERENVALFEEAILNASEICHPNVDLLDGVTDVLGLPRSVCDVIPHPSTLSDVRERWRERRQVAADHRRLSDAMDRVARQLRSDYLTANSLGCPDVFEFPDPEPAVAGPTPLPAGTVSCYDACIRACARGMSCARGYTPVPPEEFCAEYRGLSAPDRGLGTMNDCREKLEARKVGS